MSYEFSIVVLRQVVAAHKSLDVSAEASSHMCGFSFAAVTILLIAKSVLSLYLVVLLHSNRNMVLSSFFWFRVAKSFFISFHHVVSLTKRRQQ